MRRSNRAVSDRVRALRAEVEREFGLLFLVTTRVVGPVLLWSSRREARRFPAGPRLEPRMFLERRNCSVAK
jgi:uncharacterized Tic20 family protein